MLVALVNLQREFWHPWAAFWQKAGDPGQSGINWQGARKHCSIILLGDCVRVLNYPLGLMDIMYLCVSYKLNFPLIESGKHTNAFQTYLIFIYLFWESLHLSGKPTLGSFIFLSHVFWILWLGFSKGTSLLANQLASLNQLDYFS